MVVLYSSEKPNLSYVRINQNTSDGTGPSIKTYITKGLGSSDPSVVNANLLHPSLVAQPTVQTSVETEYWGNLDLPINSQDGPKEFSKSGGTVSVDNRSDTIPVACAATSLGATPKEIASARPESKMPLTSVRLPEGAVLVKIGSQQPSTNPSTTLYPTPPASRPSSLTASPPASCPSSPPRSPSSPLSLPSSPPASPSSPPLSPPLSGSSSPPTTLAARGIKRKLDDVDEMNDPQSKKTGTQSCKLIILKSRQDLIQENQRLERTNKIILAENRELRDKLDLLSRILKDPRKRDMLTARLARMQTATR